MQGIILLIGFVIVVFISHIIGCQVSAFLQEDLITKDNPYPYARGYAVLVGTLFSAILLGIIKLLG